MTGRMGDAKRFPLLLGGPRSRADRVQDGERCEQARDDTDEHRGACADERDESDREQRAADRTEVVHRPLESVSTAVRLGRDDIGEQRVARRDAQPTRRPSGRAQDTDLPGRGCDPDQRREDGGRRVAPERGAAPPIGVVRECTAAEAGDAGAAVGDPLDQSERGCGRAERRAQEGGQQRGWHLVTKIGQEAGAPDPGNTVSEPAALGCARHRARAHLSSLRGPPRQRAASNRASF
jgi:hypothetical protein